MLSHLLVADRYLRQIPKIFDGAKPLDPPISVHELYSSRHINVQREAPHYIIHMLIVLQFFEGDVVFSEVINLEVVST